MAINWMIQLNLVLVALAAAGLALIATVYLERRAKRVPLTMFAEDAAATVFLFDGEVLVDSKIGRAHV